MAPAMRLWLKRLSFIMLFFSFGAFVPHASAFETHDTPLPEGMYRYLGPLSGSLAWVTGTDSSTCQVVYTAKNAGREFSIPNTLAEFHDKVMFWPYAHHSPEGAKVQIFKSLTDSNLYVVAIAGSEGMFNRSTLNNLEENIFSKPGIFSAYTNLVSRSLLDAVIQQYIPPNSEIILTGHSQGGNVAQNIGQAIIQGGTLHDVFALQNIHVRAIITAGAHITKWSADQGGNPKFVFGSYAYQDIVPLLGLDTGEVIQYLMFRGVYNFAARSMSAFFRALITRIASVLMWRYMPFLFGGFMFQYMPFMGFGAGAFLFSAYNAIMMLMANQLLITLMDLAFSIVLPLIRHFAIAKERNSVTFWDLDRAGFFDHHTSSYPDPAVPEMGGTAIPYSGLTSFRYLGGYGSDCGPAGGKNAADPPLLGDGIPDDEWADASGCFTNLNHATGRPGCPAPPPPAPVPPPQGSPDDYEAPWTFDTNDLSITANTPIVQELVGDSGLQEGSPAWFNQLEQGLEARMDLAQANGQTEAYQYYEMLNNLVQIRNTPPLTSTTEWTPAEQTLYADMEQRRSELLEQRDFELTLGTLNGQPASAADIDAYWQAQIAADPLVAEWNATPAGQQLSAATAPLQAANEQFTTLLEQSNPTAITRQVSQLEHQIKATGLGLLKGGLDHWAFSSMSYSGVQPQMIDPTKVAPAEAPAVLVVPSGGLEAYKNYPPLRQWLDSYAAGGGTLIVLSQPRGANWEWLPGGQVRGLGYEEDIFCRDESVDVISPSPFLAGLLSVRPSLQLDGSFTQYPPETKVLLRRRTGNVMPAMIEYPYGTGRVIATSLFPDFALINGSQSTEDLNFARSFFLEAWKEATGAQVGARLMFDAPAQIPVTVTNTGRTALRSAQVTSDIAAGTSPDMWRYRVHYDDSDVFNSRIRSTSVLLAPPLQPNETRVVTASFDTTPAPGYHRIGVNGKPADLVFIDAGTSFVLPAQMRLSTDQATYWTDDVVQITAVFSSTPVLTQTRDLALRVLGNYLPSTPVTLVPGQVVTKTLYLPATEEIIGRPLRFRLVNPDTNRRVIDGLLPLNIALRPTPVRLRPATPEGVIWPGDAVTLPVRLQPTNLMTQTIDVRVESTPAVFAPQMVQIGPGSPLTITVNFTAPTSLLTAPLQLTAYAGSSDTLYTRSRAWLPMEPLEPQLDIAIVPPLSSTALPLSVRNLGGAASPYSTTVELLDGAERLIATSTMTGTLDRAAITSHAPDSDGYTLDLPGTQQPGPRYSLRYTIDGADGNSWHGRLPLQLPGVTATLQTDTERPTYLVNQTITTTTSISASAALVDGWLRLQVLRVSNKNLLDVYTLVGSAGAQGSGDGVGPAARFYWPYGATISADGHFALVADTYNHTIRYIDIDTSAVSTLAGSAGAAGSGDGVGSAARFNRPRGLALSADGSFALVADTNNHTIRRIDLASATVSTIAGSPGVSGSSDGAGASARFNFPYDVAISSDGSFAVVADTSNHTIRRIDLATNQVTTLAGLAGQTGATNGAGSIARFYSPQGITLSSDGSFALVADTINATVRRVTISTGYVITLAGRARDYGSVDGTGNTARFSSPQGVTLTANDQIAYVADTTNHSIRRIDVPTRRVTTSAGSSGNFGSADGTGPDARFQRPRDVDVSADGTLAIVVDSDNDTIRSMSFATLLRENWFPITATQQLLNYPLIDPSLSSDPRARGPLLLRGTLFGAQPDDVFPDQRQVLAWDQSGFVINSGAFSVTLAADQDYVRVDQPGSRDDATARVRLRGSVRNTTPDTGITLSVSDNGASLPAISFPDLAPGAVADFSFVVQPASAGEHQISVSSSTDTASVTVTAIAPMLTAGPAQAVDPVAEPGAWATLTVPVSNTSVVPAYVDVSIPGVITQELDLAANSAAIVTLQAPIPAAAPNGDYTIPVSISGDLNRLLNVTLSITGAQAPAPPEGDIEADVTIRNVIVTPQPAVCGTSFQVQVGVQSTGPGAQVLQVAGLESMIQRPLVFTETGWLTSTLAFSVPATLPAGEFNLIVTAGDDAVTQPISVQCWSAGLELTVPSASIPHADQFDATVIVTETSGLAAPAVLSVRYGEETITQTVQLLPHATLVTTVPLTANIGAGRVTAFLSADNQATEDPAYQPIIDSRPVNVHLGDAYVELTPLHAVAGMTVTGQLVITGPITSAELWLPNSLGGYTLYSAHHYTMPLEDAAFIDLDDTPTGSWSFDIPLPEDTPRGRYVLDLFVNGEWRPVPFDIEGPQATIAEISVSDAGACTPSVTVQMDIESHTSVVVSPTATLNGQLATVLNSTPIQLHPGHQNVTLQLQLPENQLGSGELQVFLKSLRGVQLGSTITYVQRGSVDLVRAEIIGTSRSAPLSTRLALYGNGPALITITPDVGSAYTSTVDLNGYTTLNVPLTLAPTARTVTVSVSDGAGCAEIQTLVVDLFVADMTPPSITLAAPTPALPSTSTRVDVLLQGTATDSDNAICGVDINGIVTPYNPADQTYSTTLSLAPGSYDFTAQARDCAGNRSTTTRRVVVNRSYPQARFEPATASSSESTQPLTVAVTLDMPSSVTATLTYASVGGTATPGADYQPLNGTLTFAPFQRTAVITVTTIDDALDEASEDIRIQLSNPISATIGTPSMATITLLDDDPAPALGFITSTVSVDPRSSVALVTVELAATSGQTVTVAYATSDGSASAGVDYTQTSGTLTFAPGMRQRSIQVPLLPQAQGGRSFSVHLSSPLNATLARDTVIVALDPDAPQRGLMFFPFVAQNTR